MRSTTTTLSTFGLAMLVLGCGGTPTATEDAGFAPLFNGTDLAGWEVSETAAEHWSVEDGVLRFDGVKGDLWTEGTFEDFELLVSWRWIGPSQGTTQRPIIDPDGSNRTDADGRVVTVEIEERDSGIYLRGNSKSQVNIWEWPAGSGEVYGYRTDGRMPPETRARATPVKRADRPVGEWNDFRITLVGEVLDVDLNGEHVLVSCPLPGVPESGPIGLQAHGSAIEFRNLRIRPIEVDTGR